MPMLPNGKRYGKKCTLMLTLYHIENETQMYQGPTHKRKITQFLEENMEEVFMFLG